MMFMIPMPPTISDTAAMPASSRDCTRQVSFAACCTFEMLRMEKSSGCPLDASPPSLEGHVADDHRLPEGIAVGEQVLRNRLTEHRQFGHRAQFRIGKEPARSQRPGLRLEPGGRGPHDRGRPVLGTGNNGYGTAT
jgi:hypothetical protein